MSASIAGPLNVGVKRAMDEPMLSIIYDRAEELYMEYKRNNKDIPKSIKKAVDRDGNLNPDKLGKALHDMARIK